MNKFTARILIVEDDPQIRNFISYVLSAEGFASDNAATAQSAMTLLAANVYDLMLLDLGLPDYDGMDVIRQRSANGRKFQSSSYPRAIRIRKKLRRWMPGLTII